MSSTRDFVVSALSDAALPTIQQVLEDVVMETLNTQQVPTRTDFREQRDLLNAMRGQVSAAAGTARRLQGRVESLEAEVASLKEERGALIARLEALEARLTEGG
ncbi:MAG: hypothetical protein H6741_12275 [Alphaproteobacteria bacterium]|nr:hypothetical protein [Alphaproteobacteria bacterium]MCB9793490.1 hypothetical protein [Alphaproteobacteria bacterium]